MPLVCEKSGIPLIVYNPQYVEVFFKRLLRVKFTILGFALAVKRFLTGLRLTFSRRIRLHKLDRHIFHDFGFFLTNLINKLVSSEFEILTSIHIAGIHRIYGLKLRHRYCVFAFEYGPCKWRPALSLGHRASVHYDIVGISIANRLLDQTLTAEKKSNVSFGDLLRIGCPSDRMAERTQFIGDRVGIRNKPATRVVYKNGY